MATEVVTEKDRLQIRETYERHTNRNNNNQIKVTNSFVHELEPIYQKIKNTKDEELKKSTFRRVVYFFFRPPLIAMFVGFVAGFITPLRTWLLRTDNSVYV